MSWRNDERWYEHKTHPVIPIELGKLPSVTTALSIIDKPALIPWAVNAERDYIRQAMLDVLTAPECLTPDEVWAAVEDALQGVKQSDKLKQEACNIGKQAHALIEWHTRAMMGMPAGECPVASAEAYNAYKSWMSWADDVNLEPLSVEAVVYHPYAGYAGTVDLVARVKGIPRVVDYKTSKAVWNNHYLQLIAYREAYKEMGFETGTPLILRLPKVIDDPEFEAVDVPVWDGAFEDFLAVKNTWSWNRGFRKKLKDCKQKEEVMLND